MTDNPITSAGMRSRGDELRLKAPDAVSTVRVLPSRAPECILVFLHGLLGDSYSWNVFNHHQRPSEYADCYYVDFSFESLRVEALSFHLLVREIELLMPQIVAASPAGLPVVLVGNSFGGHLALHLAAHRTVTVDGLVLFAPGGIEEVIGASQQLRAYRTVDRILEVSFERIFNDPSVAADMDLQARVARYKERLEPVRREFIRNLFGLMRSMKQCMLSHDDLRAIAAQTLLVWGDQDIITPKLVCDVLVAQIPRARVEWVSGGHAAFMEQPAASSRALREFCLAVAHPHDPPERGAA